MMNSARSKAEERFAKMRQQQKKAETERDKAQQENAQKTARIRALRLAKEASEKDTLDREDDDKATAKGKTLSQ